MPKINRKAADRPPDPLKHAWDWFDLHSKQRMQTVHFYIILVGATLAGAAAAATDGHYRVSSLLGVLLIAISVLFFGMDRRARVLVHIGEEALRREEKLLAQACDNDALHLVAAADEKAKGGLSYGLIFSGMFAIFGLTGLVIAAASLAAGNTPTASAPSPSKERPSSAAHDRAEKWLRKGPSPQPD